ncbi:MAG: PBP1A family penicillin-binding protein [Eubacterium sp.]|nr:PBP1A family penicillin-binding protein [Eubacterium sp.]
MNFSREGTRKKRREIIAKKGKIARKCTTLFFELVLVGIFALAVCIGSAGYGAWQGILDASPSIKDIDASPTGYLSTILDSKGNTTATLVASGSNRVYVTIDEIPKNLQNAFIAIEDSRFHEHNGIDIKGIIRAGIKGIAAGFRFREGASTITQQLLKNNVFTTWTAEKSQADRFRRKIQEQYLALQLEKEESKDWILENYLNTVNLGQNTLGVQSASKRYFGKDVSELTLSECAVIAGITKNPSGYNPITHPEENQKRRKKVLDDMREQGMISQQQYDKAMKDSVYSRIQKVNARQLDKSSVHSYFVDALTEQVIEDLMEVLGCSQTEAYKRLYNTGLTIYSTQDPDIQAICDAEVNNMANYPTAPKTSFSMTLTIQKADGEFKYYDEQTMLSYYQSSNNAYTINFASQEEALAAVERYKADIMEKGDVVPENGQTITYTVQPQAALTVIDQLTGEVKAIVGGRGEKTANRTLNRATDSVRQPGSTFKVLAAFAPALDTGKMTLASVEDDAPYTYSNGTPLKNYDNKYRGFTTIREAITRSINVVTVKTLMDIGIDTGYDYLTEHFGFTTLSDKDRNEAMALGGITYGVTNLELTAAYASIANGGTYIKPRLYTKIIDHDGNVLIDNQPQKSEAVQETTAWLLTNAMQDVLTIGTGKAASFEGMALAGKSGTTTKNKDALFAGFSPYYSLVVWGGFDDNTPQDGGTTSYPKLIWRSVMSRIHEGLEYKEFTMPSGIMTAEVCKKSGMPVQAGVCERDPRGSMQTTEFFAEGTVPEDECVHHAAVRVCASSGMLAGPYCPGSGYASSVRIIGGSPDSEDGPYLYTGNRMLCTVHTSATVQEPDTPEGDTTVDDTTTDTDTDDGQDPDAGQSPDTGTEPDTEPGADPPAGGDGPVVDLPQEDEEEPVENEMNMEF